MDVTLTMSCLKYHFLQLLTGSDGMDEEFKEAGDNFSEFDEDEDDDDDDFDDDENGFSDTDF